MNDTNTMTPDSTAEDTVHVFRLYNLETRTYLKAYANRPKAWFTLEGAARAARINIRKKDRHPWVIRKYTLGLPGECGINPVDMDIDACWSIVQARSSSRA